MRWTQLSEVGESRERKRFMAARARWGRPDAYEQAWLYLGQAMRRGGWFVESEAGWAAVARNYVDQEAHALVCTMSSDVAAFVNDVLSDAPSALSGTVALVKHVGSDDATRLSEWGPHWRCQELSVSNLDAASEDRLPQVVIRLDAIEYVDEEEKSLALPATSAYSDFRYQVRRGLRRLESMAAVPESVDLSGIGVGQLERLVGQWADGAVGRFRSRGWPDIVSPYETLIAPNIAVIRKALSLSEGVDGQVLLINGEPAAVWIGEDNGRNGMGIYCLLADTRWYNLAYLNLAHAMQRAHERRGRLLLLGGSELESLFRFKRVPSAQKTRLFYLRRVVDLSPSGG